MNAKHWKILLIIVGFAALGVSMWINLSGSRPAPSGDQIFIDVVTGETYKFNTKRDGTIVPPAKNPDTGERTLMPIAKSESGEWEIPQRYVDMMRAIRVDLKAVDKSGRLLVEVKL